MSAWASHRFEVEMPIMAPGEKLSEVEFLKLLAAFQWRRIGDVLGTAPRDIANAQGERLYGSVIDFEIDFQDDSGPDALCEGEPVFVRNRVGFFAKRFVEGFFVFGNREIPEDELAGLKAKSDLRDLGLPWASMTNAFIARAGGNTQLKVHVPAGMDHEPDESLSETPEGIVEHRRAQASGELPPRADERTPRRLEPVDPSPIRYSIVPESDLNGAGLVYFVRYLAMMNYAERRQLCERLPSPVSQALVACLSTDCRRVFFFGNAGPSDDVDVEVRVDLIAPGEFSLPPGTRRWRTPFKLRFRHDLYRASDRVLMASSVVRKSLNVPGDQKSVLTECERLLHQWT